jgi:hypothetical protein
MHSADGDGMKRQRSALCEIRCACARCGAHVRARRGRTTLSGMCSVCGGYELAHLSRPGPRPPHRAAGLITQTRQEAIAVATAH